MNSAEVIVFSGVPQTYTYSFTDQENYPIGCHVKIQLGQKECDGLIIKKGINEKKIPLKPIICLNEKKPILSKDLIDLMGWFQDYYHTTPYKAYQVVIGKRSLRKVEKINKHPIKETEFKLTIEQKKAVKEINNYYGYKEIVIHGITGSGKTEIYLQVAKKVIENKKNVIILVPEIALTPQFFAIFEARFGKRLALLHSGLTKKQKDIEWSKIYNEEVDIVLGPRSAIFAPFKNLGLIILDECHDSAYKQEQHPRYDTYTVAKYRCKTHEALLINGSATPQIELKYTSEEKGKSLIELNTRVNKKPLPNIQIVDMLQEEETNQSHISKPLEQAIMNCLKRKEKVIILINRRGFAPYISCSKCKKIHKCTGCGLSYTYHSDKKFRCHRCNIIIAATHKCQNCNENSLEYSGLGTQRIMAEMKKMYPDARMIRFDRDSAKTAKESDEQLKKFRSEGDILIGTQMIAKGHHIEAVTLVAVIGIESSLNLPDFRCAEQSFQLLIQVAGRAGRGSMPGKVIIQTYQPEHYAIEHAKTHDYEGFYRKEIMNRKALNYPPFSRLIHLIISSKEESALGPYLQKINIYLRKEIKSKQEVQQIGPKPAPIEKVNGYQRWQYIFKISHEKFNELSKILAGIPKGSHKIRTIIDLDPKQLM